MAGGIDGCIRPVVIAAAVVGGGGPGKESTEHLALLNTDDLVSIESLVVVPVPCLSKRPKGRNGLHLPLRLSTAASSLIALLYASHN